MYLYVPVHTVHLPPLAPFFLPTPVAVHPTLDYMIPSVVYQYVLFALLHQGKAIGDMSRKAPSLITPLSNGRLIS